VKPTTSPLPEAAAPQKRQRLRRAKNGAILGKTIGCARLAGDQALTAPEAVYAVLNPFYNFFYPNLACIDKLQAGRRKRRVYEPPPAGSRTDGN
jgi:hypothetical protein